MDRQDTAKQRVAAEHAHNAAGTTTEEHCAPTSGTNAHFNADNNLPIISEENKLGILHNIRSSHSLQLPALAAATNDHQACGAWKQVLERVVPSIVVLKVTQNRSFDTESACTSHATGFIVDLQRGIILTNRHVISPAPVTMEAIFLNREELPVTPLYFDPVHDFGFLQFDPGMLEFMRPGEIGLAPEAAAVGLDVRVVGNDSGEKVAILAGTLARLDRDAPKYGKGYNDFNTFYLQAASGTKGGSSGSPVIDIQGRAVGLNAGAQNKAASAYYLPLHRVVRALKIIQDSMPVNGSSPIRRVTPTISRGDLQTTFVFKGFDEVRRLGVTREAELAARHQQQELTNMAHDGMMDGGSHQGMLVVDIVVPGGPAQDVLQAGDVLVRMNGRVVTHFLDMDALLDDAVGKEVTVEYQRGGQTMSANLKVMDLHAVTPKELLEVGGGVVHSLSYQQARNNRVPVGQVYLAETGYMFSRAGLSKHSIITALAGRPTPDMAAFTAVLLTLQHGDRVPVEYYVFSERTRRKQGLVPVDWKWYGPPVQWTRNHASGVWDKCILQLQSSCAALSEILAPKSALPLAPAPSLPSTQPISQEQQNGGRQTGRPSQAALAALESDMRRCLVWVDVAVPNVALLDGVHSRAFVGTGFIAYLSSTLGLLVVDRNTVVISAVDVTLDFGAYPCQMQGTVRFLHPLHNFALVAFNPADLPEAARAEVAACSCLASPPLSQGDHVQLVGLTSSLKVVRRESIVTTATFSASISAAEVPRFRAVHEEVVKLDHDFGVGVSGVLTDDQGRVRAMYGSYSEQVGREDQEWAAGMQAYQFLPWVERVAQQLSAPQLQPAPTVTVLDAELQPQSLSKAAQYGLPQEWITALVQYDPLRRQVLTVRSCVAGSQVSQVLKDGDMVLQLRGRLISNYKDLADCLERGQQQVVGSKRGAFDSTASDNESKRARLLDHLDMPAAPLDDVSQCNDLQANGTDGVSVGKAGSGVPLTICRGGVVMEVTVEPSQEDGMGSNRVVHWCGAQIQTPPRCVRELGYMAAEGSGVYVSRWHHGSPAHRYGLFAMHWVLSVNGQPTPDLDAFVRIVTQLEDGKYVRVQLCHLESSTMRMLTLKPNLHMWPTWELLLNPATGEWRRHELASA